MRLNRTTIDRGIIVGAPSHGASISENLQLKLLLDRKIGSERQRLVNNRTEMRVTNLDKTIVGQQCIKLLHILIMGSATLHRMGYRSP